jgi:hypothetical protein
LDIETTFTEMKEWDTIWETLVLTVVGESLVPSTELNGIWLANRTRKGFLPGAIKLRLELWWSSDLDEARIQAKTREMTRAVKQGWNDWRIK